MDYTDAVRKNTFELVLATVKEANRIMVQEGDGSDTFTSEQVWHLKQVFRTGRDALDLLDL